MHKLAGKRAPFEILENIPKLVSNYYTLKPDCNQKSHQISFGTSGHRGSSSKRSFNENHIIAICKAICEYRDNKNITGPLFMGMDTHALSIPAHITAIEVFAAYDVNVYIHKNNEYTPTPVISHAILNYNKKHKDTADGVVITPSHNPPSDGGFKYNPPSGGPAGTDITSIIQNRANELLKTGIDKIKRIPIERALKLSNVVEYDYINPYIKDLVNIIDMESIKNSGLRIGVDPMGGAGVHFWEPIADYYNLNLEVVNPRTDPTFSFMTVDKDGKIRMDCSSPYAMKSLISLKDKYDISFGNDPDYDRHGIVTKSSGLLNPNHYLAVAINYLFSNRWNKKLEVGKTLVSSSMIDRVAKKLNNPLCEVPVGFKWFVDGLLESTLGFGGEESAGASFLRKNATVWTTDKDGIILDLLAAEITAKTKKDPGVIYKELEKEFGSPVYERIDAPATFNQKEILKKLSPDMLKSKELAGEKIIAAITNAPGNNAPIGGIKVITKNSWFAARPSGTEDIYKIYAESFIDRSHLEKVQNEAKEMISSVFKKGIES